MEIFGQGLSSAELVWFTGSTGTVNAGSPIVVSDYELQIHVPAGAATGPFGISTGGLQTQAPAPFGVYLPATHWVAAGTLPLAGGDTEPTWIASGDLNEDHQLDLVTADVDSTGGSIYFGLGDGGFASAVPYFAGPSSYPSTVVVADLNGDGHLDLATANRGPETLSVLLGNGQGTFPTVDVTLAMPTYPWGIAAGDLNGDAIPDLAASELGLTDGGQRGGVSVFWGLGDGGYSSPSEETVGVGPSQLWVGDLTSRGPADIVAVDTAASSLSVLLGKGDGGFTYGSVSGQMANFNSVAVADFNGDGSLDLVATATAASDAGYVYLFLSDGRGDFGLKQEIYNSLQQPMGIAVSDVTGDGVPDLVFALSGGTAVPGTAVVCANRPDGGFRICTGYPVGQNPNAILVADLDLDGYADIVVANAGDGTLSVLLGRE